MAGAPILIIVVVVMAVLLLAAVFMTVVIFGHPDDKNTAYFPKAVTILGLWLAFASLLVMPYDVAASRGIDEPTIRVDILWYIIYITLLILISAVIPFAIFFYESDVDPDVEAAGWGSTQWGSALKYTIGFLVFFFLVLGLMYTFLKNAIIPLQRQSNSIDLMLDLDDPTALFWTRPSVDPLGKNQSPTAGCPEKFNGIKGCITTSTTWEIPVSFPIYVMAFLAWVGWFFFAVFAGVGFLALPMDLINEFRTRPTPMSTKVYFEERATLGRRAAQLIEVGNKMRENHESSVNKKSRRENARDMREFEKHFYNLKKDYQVLYIAHKLKGGNPLVPFLKLFLGICSIVISIAWLIQIINNIFARSPAFAWLNEFFITTEGAFDGGFPLFGVMFFAIFSFYLLVIVVKGSFKLGIRFLFWKVYPMEIGNTLMNAFLVNTWIILLTSVSAVQFCAQAFPVYTRLTTVDVIFGTQVYYLTFFRLFFINKVFIYIMVAISFLAFLYGVVRPTDKSANVEATLDRLAKSQSTSLHLRDAI